jgi:N-acetylneuraminate synthase
MVKPIVNSDIFSDLFILEAANNHWGQVERGKKIIQQFGAIVRHNNIKAAIKFQIRDVVNFIHPSFKGNQEIRYIKKTEATRLSHEEYAQLAAATKQVGCMAMATPFDEASVDLCVELEFPLIKIASSDINDWPLLEKIASTKKPVIASSGGASAKALDDLVTFFTHRNIPLALNHCVSLYPSEDHQLELNQIDYLKNRYPGLVIGLSSHEYHDWEASMYISYAKGARTWERHVDIEDDGIAVSPYCSLPNQIDTWFKAYNKVREMSGAPGSERRLLPPEEIKYIDALMRGIYARQNIKSGTSIDVSNFSKYFYLAVPLQKGQLSTREIINGTIIKRDIQEHEPVSVDDIHGPYSSSKDLRNIILDRGV